MKNQLLRWVVFVLFAGMLHAEDPPKMGKTVALFDGKTLEGWEGDLKTWRVEEGAIVGGSLTANVPRNEFLCTTKEYGNFVLRLKFKLSGKEGFVNSGVQIRSKRIPNHNEVIGYQADIGDPTWWGAIYDESRRNRVLANSDMKALEPKLRRGDWNDYVIRADGARITLWINGVQTCDYTETDANIADSGIIGMQVHGGGKALIEFKDITIEELPATPKFKGAPIPPKSSKDPPLTPDEERAAFTLPDGFEIELVAAEPDIPKPITIEFDDAGRMWAITAVEYPVDANESAAQAKTLYSTPGRDRVLVFDTPTAAGLQKPRVFADGLAIPLGVLPYRDGAIVQHGTDIVFLRDTNGDGKADTREVLLTGFGIQDSHLFPHGFTRGPGGWIYLAQGAFNGGKVKDKNSNVTQFDACKMARFRPDGTSFEIVGWGLNNIWGFVINREGEMFVQEANDMGYPVTPFFIGANYPGIGNHKAKPYAPFQPPLATFQMGGTGLSGLALSEDRDGFPALYRDVMYVANPITNRIQAIKIHRDGTGYRLEKLPDFVLTSDTSFRPIHIEFGPDGCLYIVDWYNKIISHNEVPRNHPDRDKTRGRIWRVRHRDQPRRTPPDLTRVAEKNLLKHLAADNTWESRAAWHQIVERKAEKLAPQLRKLAVDAKQPTDARIHALWALEDLGKVELATFQALVKEDHRNLRREAVCALGKDVLSLENDFGVLATLTKDPDPQVRAEVIRALNLVGTASFSLVDSATPPLALKATNSLISMGTPPASAASSDREFERYLVRAALEKNQIATAAFLDSDAGKKLPLEDRLFATLALEKKTAATRLAALLPEANRPPNGEELVLLAQNSDEPTVAEALTKIMNDPNTLRALLAQKEQLQKPALRPALAAAARAQKDEELMVQVATVFKIKELEPEVVAFTTKQGQTAARQIAGLKALREMGSNDVELFHKIAKASPNGSALQTEAVTALATAKTSEAVPRLLQLWPTLPAPLRKVAMDRLASVKTNALAVVRAVAKGEIAREEIDGYALDKLHAVLKDDPELAALTKEMEGELRPVLRMNGGHDDSMDTNLTLEGAFTVEAWVKLDAGITNADGILGAEGVSDFNFHDAKFRIWAGQALHDVVIARKQIQPDVWTHVAATRDGQGRFKLYLNGEMDTDECKPDTRTYEKLDIGWTAAGGGTAGGLAEFRLWNVERTAEQIRENYNVGLAPQAGLIFSASGETWGKLNGSARIEKVREYPPLLTADEATGQKAKFAKFRALAEKSGDTAKGKALFEKNCMTCHTVGGKGGMIGPNLDGVGVKTTEELLRALLTPSAAIEGGYRVFRVQTSDGDVLDGMLVSQDDKEIVLRQPNSEDQHIPHSNVKRAAFTKLSMMPEGLLEALTPEEIANLFSHLRTIGK